MARRAAMGGGASSHAVAPLPGAGDAGDAGKPGSPPPAIADSFIAPLKSGSALGALPGGRPAASASSATSGTSHVRRKSSVRIVQSDAMDKLLQLNQASAAPAQSTSPSLSGVSAHRASVTYVMTEQAGGRDVELNDELSAAARVRVLNFATALMQSTDMLFILRMVDTFFREAFSGAEAIIHLNPAYAAKYERFLLKHAGHMTGVQAGCQMELPTPPSTSSGAPPSPSPSPSPSPAPSPATSPSPAKAQAQAQAQAPPLSGRSSAREDSSENSGGFDTGDCRVAKLRIGHDGSAEAAQIVDKLLDDRSVTDVKCESTTDLSSLGCPMFGSLPEELQTLGVLPTSPKPQAGGARTPHRRSVIAVCTIRLAARRGSGERARAFTEADATELAAHCAFLGPALERSCIESDLYKHLEYSRMMLKMSETLNRNLDARKLIESAIVMLRDALFAERGSMYLVDETKKPPDLWTIVTDNQTDNQTLRELHIPFGVGIAGSVAVTKKVELIADAYKDSRFNKEVDRKTGLKTTSMLVLPVFGGHGRKPSHDDKDGDRELLAVIQMINKKDTQGGWTAAFDQDDVDILRAFSGHVSVALSNAKVTATNKFNEFIANDLLNKMFPPHITERLKIKDQQQQLGQNTTLGRGGWDKAQRTVSAAPATPITENYPKVHVFFSDIVGFTTLSSSWPAADVVNLLNSLFSYFDFLSAKHHIYKLETIGDAYVACANAPFMDCEGRQESERQAAENIARFALEAQAFVRSFVTDNGKQIQIRCGIHCGPVFGGVVGLKMPRFCLMGDTMNTASRMESTGSPGKIHISDAFKLALESKEGKGGPFTDFCFEDLGTMPVKGKGDMHTYFVTAPASLALDAGYLDINGTEPLKG